MDINDFKKKLSDGGYPTITSARKAIGRVADWSKKTREEAHVIANKHFDGKPAAPVKAAAKKVVAKKAAPAAEPVAKKAAVVKKTAVKKSAKKAVPAETVSASTEAPVERAQKKPDYSHIHGAIETTREILNLSQVNKTLGPDAAKIAQTAERANEVLMKCVDQVEAVLDQFSSKPRAQKDATVEAFGKAVAATQPGVPAVDQNGAVRSPFQFPTALPTVTNQG